MVEIAYFAGKLYYDNKKMMCIYNCWNLLLVNFIVVLLYGRQLLYSVFWEGGDAGMSLCSVIEVSPPLHVFAYISSTEIPLSNIYIYIIISSTSLEPSGTAHAVI